MNEVNIITDPPRINNQILKSILKAKFCSHLLAANQAIGTAIKKAMRTNFKKSFDNKVMICDTLAPTTFLIPISLVL